MKVDENEVIPYPFTIKTFFGTISVLSLDRLSRVTEESLLLTDLGRLLS